MAEKEEKQELAKDRTDWAEDRTVMANERTYAGWIRTGLAAVGIGIGFNALFAKVDPEWLPKALASCFIGVGVLIFVLARGKASSVLDRLSAHRADPLPRRQIDIIAVLLSLASLSLIGALWVM